MYTNTVIPHYYATQGHHTLYRQRPRTKKGSKKWQTVHITHLDCDNTSFWKLQEMVAEVLDPTDVDPYI